MFASAEQQMASIRAADPRRLAAGLAIGVIVIALGSAIRPAADAVHRIRLHAAMDHLATTVDDHGSAPRVLFSGIRFGRITAARGSVVPADAGVNAAAAAIVQIAAGSSDDDQFAHAFALLMLRDGGAIGAFERRAEAGDARAWSDLAGARTIVAERPSDLVDALVDADRALRADARLAIGWFNRGVILERLALYEPAAESWRRCIATAGDPAIVASANERLAEVPAPAADLWKKEAPRLAAALAAGEEGALKRLVARFPQNARLNAESLELSAWADALRAKNAAAAEEHLRIARATGVELEQRSGEQLLADAVGVIDRAASTPELLDQLALAHATWRDSRVAYRGRNYDDAARGFRSAEQLFGRARSPMQEVAACYIASAAADSNRPDEACASLTTQADRLGRAPHRYRALLAHVNELLAVCHGVRGFWDEGIAAATAASTEYAALGEIGNRSNPEELLSEMYDYLGDDSAAWTHRVTAFDLASRAGDRGRVQVGLAGASRGEIQRGRWERAAALLAVEVEVAQSVNDPALIVEALTRRGRVFTELNDPAAARAEIQRARSVTAGLADAALKAKLIADLDAAEAIAERERDPRRSVTLWTSAIAFYKQSARRIVLPDLYLGRGRSRLALKDDVGALADFSSGIDELERQRGTVNDPFVRAGIFDTGEQLFNETISLLARGERWADVFRYAERSRARVMSEVRAVREQRRSVPMVSVADLQAHLAPDAVVVVFHQLPVGIAALRITRNDRIGMMLPVPPGEVDSAINELQHVLGETETGGDATTASAALFDLLLRPLGVAQASPLVVIANKALQRVPFAALYDTTHSAYLVQEAPVILAPSAAVLLDASDRDASDVGRPTRAFVVGNPRFSPTLFGELDQLPSAEREARTIAAVYGEDATLRIGSEATRREWMANAANADVIQFSGHAIANGRGVDDSLLLLADDGKDSGALHAREAASMSLPRTRLVVLAGCGTTAGDTSHVEGVRSLASAFLTAGAPVVVGTLWDISDSEADPFVVGFHRGVADGKSPLAALHDAQLDALRRGGDPRIWAAFQLYGGARETILAKR